MELIARTLIAVLVCAVLVLAIKIIKWFFRTSVRVARTTTLDSLARTAGKASAVVEKKTSQAAAAFKQGRRD
jgi:hypothetical protein